jgi:hypothetical protein
VVADEHEQDVGHGGADVGVLLHAEQADVVAPPRLVLGVGPPQRLVHELGRAVFTPQLPCLSTKKTHVYRLANSVQFRSLNEGSEWYVLDEGLLVFLEVQSAVPLPAQDLQQEDPEAEHVRLHREDAVQRELGRHVPAACIIDRQSPRSRLQHKHVQVCREGSILFLVK